MALVQLIKREVKAFLKNPAFVIMVIVLLAYFGFIGGVMRRSIEETQREISGIQVGLVLGEDTPLTRELVNTLNTTLRGRVKLYQSLREAVEDVDVGVEIPPGFTLNATAGKPVLVNGMVKVNSISMTSIQAKTSLISQIQGLIEELIPKAIGVVHSQSTPVKATVVIRGSALFFDKEVSVDALVGFLSFTSMLPLAVVIVFGSNTAYAAQFIAFEKVEKAFEMLLAQPIRRSHIVIAKIVGASIATIIFSLVYLLGLFAMLFTATPLSLSGANQVLLSNIVAEISSQLGVDIVPHALFSIMFTVVIGLLVSGSLGIVLGSLAPDERTAGILTAPIMLIYFGLGFASMFTGVQLDAVTSIVAGFTVISLPTVYMLSLVSGKLVYAIASLAISVVTCALLIAISVVLFNRDIVVLGLRIRAKRE